MKRYIKSAGQVSSITDPQELERIASNLIANLRRNFDRNDYHELKSILESEYCPASVIDEAFSLKGTILATDFLSNPNCSESTLYKVATDLANRYNRMSVSYVKQVVGYILSHPNLSNRVARQLVQIDDINCLKKLSSFSNKIDASIRELARKRINQLSNTKHSRIAKKINWNKKIPLREEWLEWAGTDDEAYAIERLEDNGHTVVDTLNEACQIIYDNSSSVDDALAMIDRAYGNSINLIPLTDVGDWEDQQNIYLQWMQDFHPEELD